MRIGIGIETGIGTVAWLWESRRIAAAEAWSAAAWVVAAVWAAEAWRKAGIGIGTGTGLLGL